MDNKVIDLMECSLDELKRCLQGMNREVALSTLLMRRKRESQRVLRAFTANLYDNWIPNNCKRGEVLTTGQIGILQDMCKDVIDAEIMAMTQVEALMSEIKFGVAAKAD